MNHHSNFEYFIAENRLADLNIKETQLEAKSSIRLHFFHDNFKPKAYFAQLRNLKITTPPDVKLFQALLTNTKYCVKLNCWQDAAFSFNESTITLNAISNKVNLQQKIFISCSLNFKYDLTSVGFKMGFTSRMTKLYLKLN